MDATETIYYANDMEITETMYFDNNSQHLNFNESGNKGDVQMSFAMAQLAQAYKIVLPSVLIIVMLAMGCTMPLSVRIISGPDYFDIHIYIYTYIHILTYTHVCTYTCAHAHIL